MYRRSAYPLMQRDARTADPSPMTGRQIYNVYPVSCGFPGCEQPAPLATDGDVTLCVEHERLRFYRPDEFAQPWHQQRASQH